MARVQRGQRKVDLRFHVLRRHATDLSQCILHLDVSRFREVSGLDPAALLALPLNPIRDKRKGKRKKHLDVQK